MVVRKLHPGPTAQRACRWYKEGRMVGILWTVAVILFVLWLLGFFVAHLGSLVHLLLVIAVIVVIWNLVTSRGRTAV
jgi:hypothetical protein